MSKELMNAIVSQEKRFLSLDESNGNILDFKQECLFARQQITKHPYTQDIAAKNPGSLQESICNVAAIGISLNPALQHAFLVPRDGRICLDISFRGLTKIATDAGSIKWAKAELVYENDKFVYRGVNEQPQFEADVFSDRGALKGGFCIARLNNGDGVLVDFMPIHEIHKVRDTSKAYKKGGGPWVDWYEEMCKKTLIKRAYKTWPQTANRQRLDKAIETLNQFEGTAYSIDDHTEFMRLFKSNDSVGMFLFRDKVEDDVYVALYNSFPQGKKTECKERVKELCNEGRSILYERSLPYVIERIDEADLHGTEEALNEYGEIAANKLIAALAPEHLGLLEIMRKESS